MDQKHPDLAHEFPEFSDKIHYLKVSNEHFRKLLEHYGTVDRAVKRVEQRIDLLSTEAEEELKKERLSAKDQLYTMLKTHYS